MHSTLTHSRFALAALICAVSVPWALAQQTAAPRMPTQAELDAQRLKMPNERDLQRSAPVIPRLDGLGVPLVTGKNAAPGVDLSKLAQQYERLQQGPGAGDTEETDQAGSPTRPTAGLLVFVSLGMPSASLDKLIDDAQRARAVLLIRGVKDHSIQATRNEIERLLKKRNVGWRIDPTLFRSLDVRAVPTYVLVDPSRPMVQPCQAAQCGTTPHSRVAGDVSLQYALQTMASGDASFAALANGYLQRLAQGPVQRTAPRPGAAR